MSEAVLGSGPLRHHLSLLSEDCLDPMGASERPPALAGVQRKAAAEGVRLEARRAGWRPGCPQPQPGRLGKYWKSALVVGTWGRAQALDRTVWSPVGPGIYTVCLDRK